MAAAIASTAPAAAPATGGLPQFDLSFWPGEIVWTLAIFLVLYLLFSRVFVPRIGETIARREDRIAGDIGQARRLKDEADAQAAAAAADTAQARAAAQKLALDAKAKAHADAAQREALEDARLAETLAKAEGQIAVTRDQAMTHVRDIASDTAAAIVAKLTGVSVTGDEISAAVTAQAWGTAMEFLQEAEVWVGVGLALFFAVLVWAKAPGAAMRALDSRAVKIQGQLDEALRLRQEAEALLADIKVRREAAEKLAAEMIAGAEADAARLRDEAAAKLDEQIKRRQLMAERKIANAEAQAAAEVKAAAAELAAQMAESVLLARLKGMTSDPLVDRAVEQIGERLQ